MCCPDVLCPDPGVIIFKTSRQLYGQGMNFFCMVKEDVSSLLPNSAVDPELDVLKKNLTLWPNVCVNGTFFL